MVHGKKGGSRQTKVVHGWYTGGTRPPGFMIGHCTISYSFFVAFPKSISRCHFCLHHTEEVVEPILQQFKPVIVNLLACHICLLDQHPICGLGQLQPKNYKLARLQIIFLINQPIKSSEAFRPMAHSAPC